MKQLISEEEVRAVASGFHVWRAFCEESCGGTPAGFEVAAAYVRDYLRGAAADAAASAAAAAEGAQALENAAASIGGNEGVATRLG